MIIIRKDESGIDASLARFAKKSSIIKQLLTKVSEEVLDDYALLAFFIIDPRSPYYGLSLNRTDIIQSVLEDYPNFERYLQGDSLFEMFFNFLKKFYKTALRDEIDETKALIMATKEIIDLNMKIVKESDLLKKDVRELMDALLRYKEKIQTLTTKNIGLEQLLLNETLETESKVRSGAIPSLLETSYIIRGNDKKVEVEDEER
jgi:hypothetical protein